MPFIVDQILSSGEVTQDYCSKLSEKELIGLFYNRTGFDIQTNPFEIDIQSQKITLVLRNIVYSGNPHPANKKRVQVLSKFLEVAKKPNCFILGIYSYKSQAIGCIFNPLRYKNATTVSYTSSHIKTEDLIEGKKNIFVNNNGDYIFELEKIKDTLCIIMDLI